MVIAEQPTKHDSDYNREFIGRGLKEIKAFFVEQGIDAHFTYALKCPKPSKELKVKPAYVKSCRTEYLQHEIEAVKPKHIIVLGSNAIYAATGTKKKMADAQGNRFFDEKLQAWVYTTVHFAQALYSEENKETMWSELKLFVGWMKGGEEVVNQFDPPVFLVDTIEGLLKLEKKIAASGGIVAADTETMGLDPYHPDRHIRTIQFCWDVNVGGVCVPLEIGPGCYYTKEKSPAVFWQDEPLSEAVKILRRILLNSQIIWHNGKFDRIWLWMWGKRNFGAPIKCPNIYMDTMHVAFLINENRALKLKRLITAEFGYPSYDIPDKMTQDMDVLIPYSTKDTVATLLLAQKYEAILNTPDMARIKLKYEVVMRRADALYTKMEIRGWPVDASIAQGVVDTLEWELDECIYRMEQVLVNLGAEFDSKNFSSPTKLSKFIWSKEGLGLEPSQDRSIAYTDATCESLSTKEDALIHVKGHKFIKYLLEFRSISKALQTYARPMLRAAETRGLLTTSYKMAKAATGRTASGKEEGSGAAGKTAKGMNLQNIPPLFDVKKIIRCPDYENEWIVEIDFSQLELRIAGEVSSDPTLIWAYSNDKDLHTYRAQRVMGLDEEGWELLSEAEQKEVRKKAKPVNFGYLFGMSAFKFKQYALVQYGVEFSMAEAKRNRELFYEDHRGLDAYYTKQERMGVRLGYVETLTGHRRHLSDLRLNPEVSKDAQRKYKEAVRQAINSPIQGFGAELKTMALIEVDEVLDPKKAKIIGEIHDSILLRVKKSAIPEVVAQILPIMRNPRLLKELGITLKVPIDADVEAGPSLGDKKELAKWGIMNA